MIKIRFTSDGKEYCISCDWYDMIEYYPNEMCIRASHERGMSIYTDYYQRVTKLSV